MENKEERKFFKIFFITTLISLLIINFSLFLFKKKEKNKKIKGLLSVIIYNQDDDDQNDIKLKIKEIKCKLIFNSEDLKQIKKEKIEKIKLLMNNQELKGNEFKKGNLNQLISKKTFDCKNYPVQFAELYFGKESILNFLFNQFLK
jgi:hypothetical protein